MERGEGGNRGGGGWHQRGWVGEGCWDWGGYVGLACPPQFSGAGSPNMLLVLQTRAPGRGVENRKSTESG